MSRIRIWQIGLLAGLAGGLLELFWIATYAAKTSMDGWLLASEIGRSVLPGFGTGAAFGLFVHFALSALIGLFFAGFLWRSLDERYGRESVLMASISLLSIVWAFNFAVLLPQLNPGIVALVPLSVGLVSKLLFGLVMGIILADPAVTRRFRSEPVRGEPRAPAQELPRPH